MGQTLTTRLLEALADLWDSVRAEHPEVPAVMLATGPHRVPRRGAWRVYGCYAATAWEPGAHARPSMLAAIDHAELRAAIQRGDPEAAMRLMRLHSDAIMQEVTQLSRDASRLRGEVFITDEVLARCASEILAVVLHEAAHTVAEHRGIKDTSSCGRYHNRRFRQLGEELGLKAEARNPTSGWSLAKLAPGVDTRYAGPVAHLAAVLQERGPMTIADNDEPAAARVLSCDCGIFHRCARRRALPARGVLCSSCGAAPGTSILAQV